VLLAVKSKKLFVSALYKIFTYAKSGYLVFFFNYYFNRLQHRYLMAGSSLRVLPQVISEYAFWLLVWISSYLLLVWMRVISES
jgi:hypothetical protein